jgi:hypothetical protein
VLATSPEEAKQVVIDNADGILQELLAMKSHNGKKILPRSSAVRITPERIGKIADGTVAGRMSTAGYKKMFGPQGPVMVKLSGGAVVDMQGQEQPVDEASFDYTMKDLGNDYAGFPSLHSLKHKMLAKIKPAKQQLYKDKMNNTHDWESLFELFKVAKARGDIISFYADEQEVDEADPGYNKHSFIGKIRRGREADNKGWGELGNLFRAGKDEKAAEKALRKGNRYYNMVRGDNKTPGGFPKTTIEEQDIDEAGGRIPSGLTWTGGQLQKRPELVAAARQKKNRDAAMKRKALKVANAVVNLVAKDSEIQSSNEPYRAAMYELGFEEMDGSTWWKMVMKAIDNINSELPQNQELDEKSKSQAQFRTMAAVAHNPEFAKKVGISQKVGKEFHSADRKQDYKDLPKEVDEEKEKGADGKACWDGYRYNGTEDGKDSCVKVSEAEFTEDKIAQDLYKDFQIFKKGADKGIGSKAKDKEIGNKPQDKDIVAKEGFDDVVKGVKRLVKGKPTKGERERHHAAKTIGAAQAFHQTNDPTEKDYIKQQMFKSLNRYEKVKNVGNKGVAESNRDYFAGMQTDNDYFKVPGATASIATSGDPVQQHLYTPEPSEKEFARVQWTEAGKTKKSKLLPRLDADRIARKLSRKPDITKVYILPEQGVEEGFGDTIKKKAKQFSRYMTEPNSPHNDQVRSRAKNIDKIRKQEEKKSVFEKDPEAMREFERSGGYEAGIDVMGWQVGWIAAKHAHGDTMKEAFQKLYYGGGASFPFSQKAFKLAWVAYNKHHGPQGNLEEMDGDSAGRDGSNRKSHSTYGSRDKHHASNGPDIHLGSDSAMTSKDIQDRALDTLTKMLSKPENMNVLKRLKNK